jgi:hypothetical protein
MNQINCKKPDKTYKHLQNPLQAVILVIFLFSCNTMAHFDAFSYRETIDAKVEVLDLMDNATEEYNLYEESIHQLQKDLLKIYEYEKNRPRNVETTKMWEIMLDTNKNLYGGYIKRWREKTTLSKFFVGEAKIQVEEAFDMIIDLENGKIRKEQANEFINKF